VADTPSQSHPEAAQFNESKSKTTAKAKKKQKPPALREDALAAGKPSTETTESVAPEVPVQPSPANIATPTTPAVSEPPKVQTPKAGSTTKAAKAAAAQAQPNLVLPAFDSIYGPAPVTTYIERIGQYLASTLRIVDPPPPPPSHVFAAPTFPKVKSAIAIGVHGYFPAAFLHSLIGQPTGTSIRFAKWGADSIRSWVDKHQPETSCEIEQVALEGEGFIADRVSTLWKLLLNWLSHLRNADLILIAGHSQGVPVATMLLAKLLQLGCLKPGARIGICAMAGINLGPYPDYKSKYLGGSAAELFEFCNSESRVSKEYASSLEFVLRHGVRITYIGSIDDQLVPLEVSSRSYRR